MSQKEDVSDAAMICVFEFLKQFWNPKHKCDALGGEVTGRWLGHVWWSLMNGFPLVPLYKKRASKTLPLLNSVRALQKEGNLRHSENSYQTPNLLTPWSGLSLQELWEINVCCLQTPSTVHLVIASGTDYTRWIIEARLCNFIALQDWR